MTNDEKTMGTDVIAPGADEPDDRQPQPRGDKGEHAPFFAIYKKGQGYWTRACTALAAVLFVLVTANYLYEQLPVQIQWLNNHRPVLLGIVVAIIGTMALLIWRMMNKPSNVDFLIATDSEMKKVNWTSKQELIGSTKVVILFMFMIAALLFVLDMYFTRVFFLLGVLVTDSPIWRLVKDEFGRAGAIALDIIGAIVVFGGATWAVYGTVKSK